MCYQFVLEPTIYTNSFFGDGDTSISFSEVNCQGFEGTILECNKKRYGEFTCSQNNVVGLICQESKKHKIESTVL